MKTTKDIEVRKKAKWGHEILVSDPGILFFVFFVRDFDCRFSKCDCRFSNYDTHVRVGDTRFLKCDHHFSIFDTYVHVGDNRFSNFDTHVRVGDNRFYEWTIVFRFLTHIFVSVTHTFSIF